MIMWHVPDMSSIGKKKNKRKGGGTKTGPDKFDKIKQEQYCHHIANGMGKIASAHAVGVCDRTPPRFIKQNKTFADAVSRAEMGANQRVENALFETALDGNISAQKFWLCNRMVERWRDTNHRLMILGDPSKPIRHVHEVLDLKSREARDVFHNLIEATTTSDRPLLTSGNGDGS